ncbi:MAG: hypothetical protein JRJ70_02140 [Deltaproteobacteria bacterium]|nr:hypothetical protein [Deltaproteobacteria bacterium]
MVRKRFFILFILTVIMLHSQLLQAGQSFLSSEQIKTMLKNNVLIEGYADEFRNLHSDLSAIIETLKPSSPKEMNIEDISHFYGYLLIRLSISELYHLLSYEIEASAYYLLLDNKWKSEEIINYRIQNLKTLRHRAQKTLEVIQESYGLTSNSGMLRLYDKAKEILRPLISALDEKINIYESIKTDTQDNSSLSTE